MAEKEITNVIKLQIEAGKATPAPPVGPALGSSGVNIMQNDCALTFRHHKRHVKNDPPFITCPFHYFALN